MPPLHRASRRIHTIFLAAAAVAVGGGIARGQMGPPAVAVAPVEQRDLESSLALVGTVEAVTRSVLATEEAGLVAERSFEEGQVLQAGDTLVKLRSDLIEQEVISAEAALAAADAQLTADRARSEQTARELKRYETLVAERAVPERDLADAATDHQVAQATLLATNATQAKQAADLQRLKLLLGKMSVRSPIAGVVAKRMVEVGQWIQQGDPVAEVVQLSPLYVRFPVPERLITRVQAGMAVQVMIDAMPGKTIDGVVDHVLPEADPATRTFPVRVKVENPDGTVRPGFFARVSIPTLATGGFVVPKDALVATDAGVHLVAIREGKAVIVPVRRNGGEGVGAYVEGDLRPDDRVVVRGNESLRPDEAVIVIGDPPPGSPPTAQ